MMNWHLSTFMPGLNCIFLGVRHGRTAAAEDAEDGDQDARMGEEDAEQGDEEALDDDVVQEEGAGLRHCVARQRQENVCVA